MNMQVGKIEGFAEAQPANAGKLDVLKNCIECLEKLAKGDTAGALNELKEALDSAKGAQEGLQKPPPGQGMDLLELLRQILEQGKKNSEANKAGEGGPGGAQGGGGPGGAEGAGGPGGAEGAGGAQGGQQAGMQEAIMALVQMLLQQLQQGGQKAA
ncbi:MAG: hypothetical protein ABW067_13640 [Rhizobacter sp.]|jgi:hypothetical protein